MLIVILLVVLTLPAYLYFAAIMWMRSWGGVGVTGWNS